MKVETPCEATRPVLQIDVREIEAMLQAPPMDLKPWPGATIELKDGSTMYIREAKMEEANH